MANSMNSGPLRRGSAPDPFPELTLQHEGAKARFQQLMGARTTLDKVRTELQTLQHLGDSVTPEEVIKGAGTLVAHGLGPQQMASLLATMPEGGEALQAWVQQHVLQLDQRDTQLAPALELARHAMGLSALRLVAAHLHGMPGNVPAPGPATAPSGPSAMPDLTSGGPSAT